MATATGILNHQSTTAQALTGKTATSMLNATADSTSSSDTSSSSATITANDFLTLLVTELQNQDPTANTDPNEYINQLVEVNSLEQLISINETLTDALDSSSSSSSSAVAGKNTGTLSSLSTTDSTAATGQTTSIMSNSTAAATTQPASASIERVAGNLGVPGANASAERVAHALDGR